MRAGPAFLDSGIFIAFLDRSDAYHAAARELFAQPPRRWLTSILVVSETYGWFLHKLGEESARAFRDALDSLPRLRLLGVDESHHRAVLGKLDSLRGHKLTYVDASILVFVERHDVREVWGVDQHLSIEGTRVLPT